MFTTLIVNPIFNLLVLIYAVLPGHNFGLAIILFTVLVRLLMWPLVKKQLHQAKAMRELQPELKRIKLAAKGDRQKESALMMELYKEKEINPFSSIGLLLVQLPIFIGLYSGLHRIVLDPKAIVTYAYPSIANLPWIQTIAADITKFDSTLFGIVDLTRAAIGKTGGGIYWPAMLIVIASAVMQYYQAKQLMPDDKEKRTLRSILKEAGDGTKADQGEINAAVGRSTRYMLPVFIFIVTVNIASALSLYWLVSGIVAFMQQSRVLGQDQTEMTTASVAGSSTPIEAEVIPPKIKTTTKLPKKGSKKSKKRR
ncbi:MAG: YidC/Oxa1 family membrane protein insertase [Candidatus Saccharibacteria bacterium]|nr:YidC/Oxa1 family membrane protein insertase [Candidatus Saccharibacteria bacterium]